MNSLITEALKTISKEIAGGNLSSDEMEQLRRDLLFTVHFIEQNQIHQAKQCLKVA